MKNYICIFFISICFVSCINSENYTYSKFLSESGFRLNDFSYIIIIPNEGCTGCITDTASFVQEHIHDSNRLGVLFTKVIDKKLLKQKIGYEVFELEKKVKIDEKKFFDKPEFNTIYPQIVKINNGKVIEIGDFSKDKLISDLNLKNF